MSIGVVFFDVNLQSKSWGSDDRRGFCFGFVKPFLCLMPPVTEEIKIDETYKKQRGWARGRSTRRREPRTQYMSASIVIDAHMTEGTKFEQFFL